MNVDMGKRSSTSKLGFIHQFIPAFDTQDKVTGMGEFLLPYDVVRNAKSPDDVLLSFLQTTYEAEAICAKWDRYALERQ